MVQCSVISVATTSSADTWGWLWQKTFSFWCATVDGTVASSSFGLALCFVVLRARACPLKDDSSQACLDHAVRMINSKRWSWWFIGGPTMTPQLPRGSTGLCPGTSNHKTMVKTNFWGEAQREEILLSLSWLIKLFLFFQVDKLYLLSEKFGWNMRIRSQGGKKLLFVIRHTITV